ncbi:hypothetical protein GYMLUDRAFT_246209 [Collybiopsis luxurians FD-317 M1]|uniref:Uncharacterized protein n=1 Tax=Collybiopsis luxurians FD-317 M1 TaxID=944289 RepID=A0A0D0B4F5_9AGAR|nr:hypothetical protein GYMLUDRAFT_246209 [Collybiopsis luxurians FD-317 M1]
MPGAYVCGVYDSVLHPMLICLSHCGLDKTRKSTVRKRLDEIDAAVRNRKTRFRPCFVIPERKTNLDADRERKKICLMATFDGSGIDDLPRMLRYFVTPVKSGSKDGYTKTFKDEECITTTPLWKPKEGVQTQWVICFLYEVNTADLRPWKGDIALDAVEQDRLVKLCDFKRKKWFEKALGSPLVVPVQMLKSILEFAAGDCEDRNIFASRITIPYQGQSRATFTSQATYRTRTSQLRGSTLRQSHTHFGTSSPIKENFSTINILPSKMVMAEKKPPQSTGKPKGILSLANITKRLESIAIQG